MKIFGIILINILSFSIVFSQDTINYVAYDKNYKFNEGLFLTFDQVKMNSPIPQSNIITNIDKSLYDFYDVLFLEDEITIINDAGVQQVFNSTDFWGFASNGKLYINWEYSSSLIPVIGSIAHFVGTIVYYDYSYSNDPFGTYNEPAKRTETKQYALNFKTGEIYPFNFRDVDPIFSDDAVLYDEWSDLSRRKKKKKLFVYVRKYNDRNPLMLPKN